MKIRRKRPPPKKQIAVPLKREVQNRGELRALAEVTYIAGNMSLAELSALPIFARAGIHARTWERWSAENNFVAQRAEFQRRQQAQVLERIGEKLAAQRVGHLNKLESIFENVITKLESAKPRSYEAVVRSAVAVSTAIAEWHGLLKGFEARLAQRYGLHPNLRPRLTEEEKEASMAAAHAVMQKRRERLRQQTPAES